MTWPSMTLAELREAARLRADLPTPSTTSAVPTSEWTQFANAATDELYGLLRQSYGDSYYAKRDGYRFVTGSFQLDVSDVAQTENTDFTKSGTTVTFTTAPASGAAIRANYTYGTDFNAADSFTGDGSTVAFTLSQTPSGDTLGSYMLPSDFLAIDGANLLIGGYPTGWMTIRPFPWGERNRWSYPATTIQYGRTNLRYCVRGDYLHVRPWPQTGLTVKIDYIPRRTALSSDSDSTDGFGGWLEYVIVDMAIRAREKQDRDVGPLTMQKMALKARIEGEAANRDAGEPAHVTDSQGAAGWFGGGSYHGVWPGDGL